MGTTPSGGKEEHSMECTVEEAVGPSHGPDCALQCIFISHLTLKMSLNFPESVSPANWNTPACSLFGN